MIQFKTHENIDKAKWDDCVKQSPGGFPYACSWWLDVVCPGWAALVMDDFEAVMPLPLRRKFTYSYVFQPYFTQQLGILSKNPVDAAMTSAFLSAIPGKFRYVRIHLNNSNALPGDFNFTYRRNYTLSLTQGAANLTGNYHRNCRRNIQKAKHAGLTLDTGPGPLAFSRFIERHLDRQLGRVPHSIYPTLTRLIQVAREHCSSEITGVYDKQHELAASGWFVFTPARCLFLICASTKKGRDQQAMYLLVDDMIRRQADTGRVFDFTGSNLPGVAYFDAGFGAIETFYPTWVRNNLPWPLRILKS